MNTVQELREKRTTYVRSANFIIDRAEQENRGFNADERKSLDDLRKKVVELDETLDRVDQIRDLTADGNGETHSNRGPVNDGPFPDLGSQLAAVVRAGMPGQQPDERLYSVRAPSGLGESVGGDGGYLLQTTFSYDLLNRGMTAAKVAPLCSPFPIGADSKSIDLPYVKETSRATGSRFGGIQLAWLDAGEEISSSKPKFEKLHLEPRKLAGLVYLTDELVQDSTVLDAFVRRAFASEFAFVVDDAILRGNGAGKPLGVFNSPARVTVAKESGQLAKTIVYENIVNMWSRLPAASAESAIWLVNQDTMPQLMTMVVGIGVAPQPVFTPPGGASAKPYGTIFTRPVMAIEQASTVGTEGDVTLADLSRYLLSTRGALQVASSIHVRFIYDEMALRFIFRIDGQPDLAAPITPYQGTTQQSPFVTLATRA